MLSGPSVLTSSVPGSPEDLLEHGAAAGPAAEQKPDRLGAMDEPARGEPERLGGGPVEPLDVVDRDQQRRARCRSAEKAQKPGRGRERRWRLLAWIRPAGRYIQCVPLRRRHRRHGFRRHVLQQVSQAGEQQARLRLAGPRAQHQEPAVTGIGEAGLPHRCLADTGVSGEQQAAHRPRDVEQRLDRLHFDVAADPPAAAAC